MLVRPMTMAPALFSRATTSASTWAGALPASNVEPARVTTACSSKLSLIETGIPASSGSLAPARLAASTRSAAASASNSLTARKARTPSPCESLMAANACSTSIRLVHFRSASACKSSVIVMVLISCPALARLRAPAVPLNAAPAPAQVAPTRKSRLFFFTRTRSIAYLCWAAGDNRKSNRSKFITSCHASPNAAPDMNPREH